VAKGREQGVESGQSARKTAAADGSPDMADLKYVKGLIEAIDSSGIDSLEITRAGTRVKISKTPPSAGGAGGVYYSGPPALHASPAPGPNAGPQATPQVGEGSTSAAAPAAGPGDAGAVAEPEGSTLIDIPSPMVGTFYRAPAPEAPPYVEVGSRVAKGQTLCIIEAMKLMNELESEVEGVVRQVLVENAEPVEYGQALFRVDPSG